MASHDGRAPGCPHDQIRRRSWQYACRARLPQLGIERWRDAPHWCYHASHCRKFLSLMHRRHPCDTLKTSDGQVSIFLTGDPSSAHEQLTAWFLADLGDLVAPECRPLLRALINRRASPTTKVQCRRAGSCRAILRPRMDGQGAGLLPQRPRHKQTRNRCRGRLPQRVADAAPLGSCLVVSTGRPHRVLTPAAPTGQHFGAARRDGPKISRGP